MLVLLLFTTSVRVPSNIKKKKKKNCGWEDGHFTIQHALGLPQQIDQNQTENETTAHPIYDNPKSTPKKYILLFLLGRWSVVGGVSNGTTRKQGITHTRIAPDVSNMAPSASASVQRASGASPYMSLCPPQTEEMLPGVECKRSCRRFAVGSWLEPC